MTNTSEHFRSNCPINFLLETVGDKWSLLIIRDIMFKNKRTFGELLSSAEGIATNILSQRLKHLEECRVIEKSIDRENRSKRLYTLTEKGRGLLPLMLEITAWSAEHDSLTNTPPDFIERLVNDRATVIEEFNTLLKEDS